MSASTCWAPTCWLAGADLLACWAPIRDLRRADSSPDSQRRPTTLNLNAESQHRITAWNHSAVESQARTSCELARLLDEPPKYVAVRRLHSPSKYVAVPRLYSPSTFHRAPQPTPRAARRPPRRAALTAPGQARGRPPEHTSEMQIPIRHVHISPL